MGGITGELFRTFKGLVVLAAVMVMIIGAGATASLGGTVFKAIGQGAGIVVAGIPQLAAGFKQTGPTGLGGETEQG